MEIAMSDIKFRIADWFSFQAPSSKLIPSAIRVLHFFNIPPLPIQSNPQSAIRISNHIRKGSLGSAKIPDAEKKEEGNNKHRQNKARHINGQCASANGPAEPIDDANERIQGIEEAPLLRDN